MCAGFRRQRRASCRSREHTGGAHVSAPLGRVDLALRGVTPGRAIKPSLTFSENAVYSLCRVGQLVMIATIFPSTEAPCSGSRSAEQEEGGGQHGSTEQ